jgi:hypothetical protein
MPCYRPLHAIIEGVTPEGNKVLNFKSAEAKSAAKIYRSGSKSLCDVASIYPAYCPVPCGRCTGCLVDRSRDWSVRCVHEASLHKHNSFVTLTYNDDYLPPDGGLCHRHFQLFMKRLRKFLGNEKVKFFMCGEYGTKTFRPHYHACIFNCRFPDQVNSGRSKSGDKVLRSEILDKLWSDPVTGESFGFATTGYVTARSAAYVARYVLKKRFGADAGLRYVRNHADGSEYHLPKEYSQASKHFARDWFDKYSGDCYPKDFITVDKQKRRVPRYYDKLLSESNPDLLLSVKTRRKDKALSVASDNTYDRMRTKEQCLLAQMDAFARELE